MRTVQVDYEGVEYTVSHLDDDDNRRFWGYDMSRPIEPVKPILHNMETATNEELDAFCDRVRAFKDYRADYDKKIEENRIELIGRQRIMLTNIFFGKLFTNEQLPMKIEEWDYMCDLAIEGQDGTLHLTDVCNRIIMMLKFFEKINSK